MYAPSARGACHVPITLISNLFSGLVVSLSAMSLKFFWPGKSNETLRKPNKNVSINKIYSGVCEINTHLTSKTDPYVDAPARPTLSIGDVRVCPPLPPFSMLMVDEPQCAQRWVFFSQAVRHSSNGRFNFEVGGVGGECSLMDVCVVVVWCVRCRYTLRVGCLFRRHR